MSSKLSEIFGELGILQHLDAFVDQGFDTWDTILDITESDLDALGVKLGHRRKLQRRIANARGIPPNAVLASPTKPSVEDIRSEANKPDASASSTTDGRDLGVTVIQKRKYRRHPKPDENAPERPPSAYVLFSNKMRDDLKGQNLTFTEIAKLVGENWQGLTQAEKEPYERQAQSAKEKYNHDLAEYKQTAGYKKYLQYLQDFKAKHATSQDKDAGGVKRMRLAGSATAKQNGLSNRDTATGRTGSFGEAHAVDQPLRRQRIGSLVSNGDASYYAPSVLSAASMHTPTEDSSGASPNGGYFDRRELSPCFSSPRDNAAPQVTLPMRRDPAYVEASRNEGPIPSRHLPSLSDVIDGRQLPNGASYSIEQAPPVHMLTRGYQTVSPAPTPSTAGSESRPPSLRTDQSGGSMSSGSSYSSYPRTPTEGSVPVHTLLSSIKQYGPPDSPYGTNMAMYRSMSPDDRSMSAQYPSERAPNESIPASGPMPHLNGYYSGPHAIPSPLSTAATVRPQQHAYGSETKQGQVALTTPNRPQPPNAGPSTATPASRPEGKTESRLDGISALLQADRIVDRRN